MPAQTVNQIEWQFMQLTPQEQLLLLERLATTAEHNNLHQGTAHIPTAPARIVGARDRAESRSAEADLLSEAW
jgi:hypothetical protein